MGEGPMTGRQLGYGAGYDSPGYTKGPGSGLGRRLWGRGPGRGSDRGYAWRHLEPDMPENEYAGNAIESLRSEISELRKNLHAVMEHLKSTSAGKAEK
jgi:hypothetical protein